MHIHRFNFIVLVFLLNSISCDFNKKVVSQQDSILSGKVVGDGKILPLSGVPGATVNIICNDSLHQTIFTDSNGCFDISELSFGNYLIEICKDYPFDNRAWTKRDIQINKFPFNLGELKLEIVKDDYFPLRKGSQWIYDQKIITSEVLRDITRKSNLIITITDGTTKEDTIIYSYNWKSIQYSEEWDNHIFPDTIYNEILVTIGTGYIKEINGLVFGYFPGFHVYIDSRSLTALHTRYKYSTMQISINSVEKVEYNFAGNLINALKIEGQEFLENNTTIVYASSIGPVQYRSHTALFDLTQYELNLIQHNYLE